MAGRPTSLAAEFNGQVPIYWMHQATRTPGIWLVNQTRFENGFPMAKNAPSGWILAGVADFNGDQEADFVWRDPKSGSNTLRLMRGTNEISTVPLPDSPAELELAAVADLDGDGDPDMIWKGQGSRETTVWFMEQTRPSGRIARLPAMTEDDFVLVAAGDLNRDGYADLFWRNEKNGRNVVALMAGTNVLSRIELKPNPETSDKLSAVGRFDRVGNLDLVWRRTNGLVSLWMMSGTSFLESIPIRYEPDTNWVIVGTTSRDQPLAASARVGDSGRSLEISWAQSQPPTMIQRRELGSSSNTWTPLPASFRGTSFADSNAVPGITYEYQVDAQRLRAAIQGRPVEHRGSVILAVERTVESALRNELDRFRTDLIGDGWKVIRTTAPRHEDANWSRNLAGIASLKGFITSVHKTSGLDLKAVILVGHVPIPYSGLQNPDGHAWRSLPADSYYGDLDGKYTDGRVNDPGIVDGFADRRWANVPSDGKWDQDYLPPNEAGIAELELAVGRIDFSKLPEFRPKTEIDLLRQYLEKDHRYRHKLLTFPDRVVVGSFLPAPFPNELVYQQAVRLGSQWFGTAGGGVVDGEPFHPKSSALWGLHAAWGLPSGIRTPTNTYVTTTELANVATQPKLGFIGVYGSYFEDWEYTNNFMRAALAPVESGLGAFWFQPAAPGEGALRFDGLALGETIGEGWRQTVNQSENIVTKRMFLAYLGDPTLPIHIIAPPAEPTATPVSSGVHLGWRPSIDPAARYVVYRSGSGVDGTWTRLTEEPVQGLEFVDAKAPAGGVMYQVRALSLSVTGGGSFTNLSQGIFVSRR